MASHSSSGLLVAPRFPPLSSNDLKKPSSVSFSRNNAPRFQSAPLRLRISCAAKTETVDKVRDIVVKQLALTEGSAITGETKFTELGADSLDTVEIVMKLEEEFGVVVEEESAQSIATIGQAAELIETLKEKC